MVQPIPDTIKKEQNIKIDMLTIAVIYKRGVALLACSFLDFISKIEETKHKIELIKTKKIIACVASFNIRYVSWSLLLSPFNGIRLIFCPIK